jgi:hypothetical protein
LYSFLRYLMTESKNHNRWGSDRITIKVYHSNGSNSTNRICPISKAPLKRIVTQLLSTSYSHLI